MAGSSPLFTGSPYSLVWVLVSLASFQDPLSFPPSLPPFSGPTTSAHLTCCFIQNWILSATFFRENGFPVNKVNSFIRKFLDSKYLKRPKTFDVPKLERYFVLPHFGSESEKMKQEVRSVLESSPSVLSSSTRTVFPKPADRLWFTSFVVPRVGHLTWVLRYETSIVVFSSIWVNLYVLENFFLSLTLPRFVSIPSPVIL